MDRYIEIQVLPDPEFMESTLLNALFAKLHRAMDDVGNGEIGISFPKADKNLGNTLRLHGTQEALGRLMAENWIKGLRDYTRISEIQPVPDNAKHRRVRRFQAASSVERKRRRSIKKGWLSEAEAVELIPMAAAEKSKLPFLEVKSNSNEQRFRLFIQQMPVQEMAAEGTFSNYGLSSFATVPYF